ncbi:uncharacterized protein QC761_0029650 [Podospora bellae-mahoneyi]|nr:hypothetical protein QC761_0029650 [Podospora bellae-mahoneyi]
MMTLQYADMLRAQEEVDAIFWIPEGNVADVLSQTFGHYGGSSLSSRRKAGRLQNQRQHVLEPGQQIRYMIMRTAVDWCTGFFPTDAAVMDKSSSHQTPFNLPASHILTPFSIAVSYAATFRALLEQNRNKSNFDRLSDERITTLVDFVCSKLSADCSRIPKLVGMLGRGVFDMSDMESRLEHSSLPRSSSESLSETVLGLAFESLSSQCRTILKIMSVIEPTCIPKELFDPVCLLEPHPLLSIQMDEKCLLASLENLVACTLIDSDEDLQCFCVDNMVAQNILKGLLTTSEKHTALSNAAILLSIAFPECPRDRRLYPDHQDGCAKYLKHALTLRWLLTREYSNNKDMNVVTMKDLYRLISLVEQ